MKKREVQMQPWHYWKNDPFKAWIFSGHFSSSRDGTRIFQSGSSYPHVWSNWGPKYFGWVSKSWRPSPKKFFLLLLVRSDWQITVTLSTKLYCLSLENIIFRHVRNKSRSLEIFASTHERVLLSSFCAILTNHRPSISCLKPPKLFQPFVLQTDYVFFFPFHG